MHDPRRIGAMVAAAFAIGLGCQSESAPAPDLVRTEGPPGECQAFAAALCDKHAACVGAPGGFQACVRDAVAPARFNCAQVTGVSTGYDGCLRDVTQSACPLAVPASCQDILKYGGTAAPPSADAGSSGAGGKAGGGGTSSYRCDASGSFSICDGTVCRIEFVNVFGFGSSELEAGAKAQSSCANHMNGLVIANNIAYHAYVVVPCGVISCGKI